MRYSVASMRRSSSSFLLTGRRRVARAAGQSVLACLLAVMPQVASALEINVRGGVHDDYNRLVFDWPRAPRYALTRDADGLVTLSFQGEAAGFVLSPSAQKLERIAGFAVTPQTDGSEVRFRVAPSATVKDFLSGSAVVIDIKGPAAPQSGAGGLKAATPVAAPVEPTQPAVGAAPKPALSDQLAAVPAVLFERGQRSYALLDKRGKVPVAGAAISPLDGVPGWQRGLQDDAKLVFENDGQIRLAARTLPGQPDGQPLAVTAQPDYAAGGRVLVNVTGAGSVLSFIDPALGDPLYAVSAPPGQFVAGLRHFAAFDLLPTRQGVVIRPLNDKLTVRLTSDGLEISVPDGLKLSPASPATAPAEGVGKPAADPMPDAPAADVSPAVPALAVENAVTTESAAPAPRQAFFEVEAFQAKRGESFTAARQRYQNAVAGAGSDDADLRAIARLNLARFYLADAYGQEARGLLQDVAADTPELAAKPEFRGMRGMARVLAEDPDGGLEDLALPELADYRDLELWRGVAAAKQHDFTRASKSFAAVLDVLAAYPEPFFSRFAQLAGESFLATGDNDNAKRIVMLLLKRNGEVALDRPAILYLRGVIESRVGSLDAAKKLWTEAAESQDMLTRTRAGMALVDLGLAAKTMAPTEAANRLERLRFGWRGDSLELDLLQRLANAYAAAGQLDEGLGALEKAKRIAPTQATTDALAAQQRQIFSNLFMSKAVDDYPALKTLATYNRYRQYAPLDPAQATAVNNRLVDKMLKIDLLGQAADLLEQQLPLTNDPAAKGKLGARITGVRILNLEPTLALKALDASEAKDLPLDLVEERRLLRARALADSGQPKPALAGLTGDGGDDAKRLAATIAWRAKDWPGAATALAALIPPPPADKLTPEQGQLVVRRAVALTLAGDSAALAQLARDYGAGISGTPSAASFDLLTAPTTIEGGAIKAMAALPGEMRDVDLFKDFLESYRK